MPRQIIKKVLPEYFQDIVDGKKKYELRLNDFDVEPGGCPDFRRIYFG